MTCTSSGLLQPEKMLVDPARIELATSECKSDSIPFTYKPMNHLVGVDGIEPSLSPLSAGCFSIKLYACFLY